MRSFETHPVDFAHVPHARLSENEADALVRRFVWRRRGQRAAFVILALGIGALAASLSTGRGSDMLRALREAFVVPPTPAPIVVDPPPAPDPYPNVAPSPASDEVEQVGLGPNEVTASVATEQDAFFDDALAQSEATEPAPQAARVNWIRRGDDLYGLGRAWDALLAYERAAEHGDRPARAYVGMGRSYQSLRKHDAAIVQFRRALLDTPDYAPAVYYLAASLQKSGDLVGALTEYQRYLALEPDGRHSSDALEAIQVLEATPR